MPLLSGRLKPSELQFPFPAPSLCLRHFGVWDSSSPGHHPSTSGILEKEAHCPAWPWSSGTQGHVYCPSLLSRPFFPKQLSFCSIPVPSRHPEQPLPSVFCCLPFPGTVDKNVLGDLWRKDKGVCRNVVETNQLIFQNYSATYIIQVKMNQTSGIHTCVRIAYMDGFRYRIGPMGKRHWETDWAYYTK